MNKNIKITIEGWEDKPVVLENVEMFNLLTNSSDTMEYMGCGDITFAGYVAARTQCAFMEAISKAEQEDEVNE